MAMDADYLAMNRILTAFKKLHKDDQEHLLKKLNRKSENLPVEQTELDNVE